MTGKAHVAAALLAVAVFSALFWSAGSRATALIDGTRYHYLDDDQMISMRYARNLASGHGAVWNAGGERVEGYTNFGWMLVMTAVHAAGAPDATASLWVRGINWVLGCLVIVLTIRLMVDLGADAGVSLLAAAGMLAVAKDLLFWSINGFETTLLTVLFLWALRLALADARRGAFGAWTCIVAGLLPVVRADAVDLTAAVVIAAAMLGARRRWWLVGLAVLPFVANEAFRVVYYGDWLPNTYYLKVAGRAGLFVLGLANLKAFAATYTVALVSAAAGVMTATDPRIRVLGALIVLGFGRVLFVGPDIFPGFRFLAPYLPLLLAVAVASIAVLARREPAARWVMLATLVVATVFNAGTSGRESFAELISTQADPYANTVAGVMMRQTALPESRVLVAAAGCLPYFSHLESIDMLGKNDRHVARVRPGSRGRPGVNRFDVDWSLRDRPEFVSGIVSYALASQPRSILETMLPDPSTDFVAALLLNDTFIDEYRDQTVPVQFLLDRHPVFVHRGSREAMRLGEWRQPGLGHP